MKKILLPTIVSVLLFMASCGGGNTLPDGVMEKEKMVDFLSEAYLLEGFYAIETNSRPSAISDEVKASYNQLLEKYQITESEFRTSMDYYSQHLEENMQIHQEVLERIEGMEQELE